MLARLHQTFKKNGRTLLHLDFARANILFKEKNQISGILDFEEAKYGKPEEDLACSLAFFVADSPNLTPEKIFTDFLKGYQNSGGKFNYDKIKDYYAKFLVQRMEEKKSRPFDFISQAKKKLAKSQKQVKEKILSASQLTAFRRKNTGRKIVFTVGAFELLHWGHLEFLKKAKTLGDLLVVGIASDESRRKLKGEPYPLITDRTRAETLAHFPFIDAVVVVNEENVCQEIKLLKPKVFYTVAKDWREGIREENEEKLVKAWQGKVIKARYLSPNLSSSRMVEKVALIKIRQMLGQKIKRQPILGFKKPKGITKEVKFSGLSQLGQKLHKRGKTIVFASLTADLFHLGHARFIQKAKSVADVLVVGVPSNESVRFLKGAGRPFIDEKARALVMASLPWVDYVVIFDERTILGCLRKLKPDIFFTVKEDWNIGFLSSLEAQLIKSIGSKIVRSEKQSPYLSASRIIDKAAGEMVQKKFSDLIKVTKETPVFDADNGFDPHSLQAQLAAREKGFYGQVLKSVAQRGKCVFCDLKEKYLVKEKDGVVLTVALFPYLDGHLLIIPRRHLERIGQLNRRERESIFWLCVEAERILKEKLGIANVWLILREGEGIKAGKTVTHLHFHIIPYDSGVIKMVDQKITMTPLEMAKRLRGRRE